MTGFGKASCELEDKVVTIEIKSLNSKQLDIYARIPNFYREKELDIRNMISQKLNRGKIEININYESTSTVNGTQINTPLVKEYFRQLKKLGGELNVETSEQLLAIVMRFPDTLKVGKEELNEEEWSKVSKKIQEALEGIDQFRRQEGIALKKDITERLKAIENLLNKIDPYEEERINYIREKLSNNLSEIADKEKIDNNRFEQELIYYLEKLDITEEKVRLGNHCRFFLEVIEDEYYSGKKLGFIAQEMGREINTLGAKANHSDIQRVVVQMKDELEKIKEQLMNVL